MRVRKKLKGQEFVIESESERNRERRRKKERDGERKCIRE